MSEWVMEQVVPRTREVRVRWDEDSVFLPDHFLYRGVVRTVVRVLGSWGRGGGAETKETNH